MKVTTVRGYKIPGYPEKKNVLRNPGILTSVPKRWRCSLRTCMAFSSLLFLTLTACGQTGSKTGTSTVNVDNIDSVSKGRSNSKNNAEGKVAPIFEHGDGRGAFGCDSVAPPSFLSEEEAFEVIEEEAKRQGIVFTMGGPKLTDVKLPVTDLYPSPERMQESFGTEKNPYKTKKGNIDLDGYDEERNIAFEYVSTDDFEGWAQNTGIWSSVATYDVKQAAKSLREGIKDKNGDNHVAVFYDPILNKTWAKKELKEQVKDFINWLKAEGII